MITLKVEDYCQNCDEFDPHVVRIYNGLGLYHTEVMCGHSSKCAKIAKLIKEVKSCNDVQREVDD